MGEKARCATYDRLFFERREALEIRVYPVDSEKITVRESSAECYSELPDAQSDGRKQY